MKIFTLIFWRVDLVSGGGTGFVDIKGLHVCMNSISHSHLIVMPGDPAIAKAAGKRWSMHGSTWS